VAYRALAKRDETETWEKSMIVYVDPKRQTDEQGNVWVRILFFYGYPCRATLFLPSNVADSLKLEGGKSYEIKESSMPYPEPCAEWDKYFGK
jgi:hypothetical protein